MKKYFAVNENSKGITHIKCEVYYSLGGMNYFTYKQEGRGYYASVTPVERREENYNGHPFVTEGFMAFSGIKQLVKEVSRKSDKAMQTAEKIAETVFPSLIEYVCNKEGLSLAMETTDEPKAVEVA